MVSYFYLVNDHLRCKLKTTIWYIMQIQAVFEMHTYWIILWIPHEHQQSKKFNQILRKSWLWNKSLAFTFLSELKSLMLGGDYMIPVGHYAVLSRLVLGSRWCYNFFIISSYDNMWKVSSLQSVIPLFYSRHLDLRGQDFPR